MDQTPPSEWAHLFEKADDILRVPPPPGLRPSQAMKFALARTAANNARRGAEDAAKAAAFAAELPPEPEACAVRERTGPDVPDSEDCLDSVEKERQADEPGFENRAIAAPAPVRPPAPPFAIPDGKSDELLERQIASCAGLIEHLARYIARADADPYVCATFMDRMTSLMKSSANAGKVIGHLRGVVPEETRHRMIVQHEGGRGESEQ